MAFFLPYNGREIYIAINRSVRKTNKIPHTLDSNGSCSCLNFRKTIDPEHSS